MAIEFLKFSQLDGMFVCINDMNKVGLIENTLTSIPFPNLNRAYVSFHHICGNNSPLDGGTARDCSIQLGLLAPESNAINTIFHDIPNNKIYNDGTLSQVTEMQHESISIPLVTDGHQLRIRALFDSKYGGFGVDNFKLYTPQRYFYGTSNNV